MNRKMMVTVLVIVFAGSLVFGYTQYQQNKKYEFYISEQVANMVSPLSSAILKNDEMLKGIIKAGMIKKPELDQLQFQFLNIQTNAQDVTDLLIKTDKINHTEVNNLTSAIAAHNENYMRGLQTKIGTSETLKLTKEDIKNFQQMDDINEKWTLVVQKTVPGATSHGMTPSYWEQFSTEGINHPEFIQLIKDLSIISKDYQSFIN